MSLPLSVSRCPHFLMMDRFYLPRDQQNWLLLLSKDEPEQLSHWCSQNLWTFCWYCFMLSAPCFCAYKMHSYPSIRSSCCRCCFIQGPSFLNMNLFKSHLIPEHFFGYCDLTLVPWICQKILNWIWNPLSEVIAENNILLLDRTPTLKMSTWKNAKCTFSYICTV